MIRPQFSIRLLLLIVAVVAVLIAWRQAVWQVERPERLRLLRNEYWHLQNYRLRATTPIERAKIDAEINTLGKQIENLHPSLTD
jgi:hypothetical protein